MMYGNDSCPCKDCENRTATCHGHGPDGTWKCSRWAAYQEQFPEREQKKKIAIDLSGYRRDTKTRCMRIKERGR